MTSNENGAMEQNEEHHEMNILIYYTHETELYAESYDVLNIAIYCKMHRTWKYFGRDRSQPPVVDWIWIGLGARGRARLDLDRSQLRGTGVGENWGAREASGARRRPCVGLMLNTRGIWEGMDLDREEIPMWERSGRGEGQAS